jgi:hypothetical protein
MLQKKNYIDRKKVEKVFGIIKNLQEASPLQSVSKAAVSLELVKRGVTVQKAQLLSYRRARARRERYLQRSFKKLVSEKRIVRNARGQYWLPSYLERNIEYLKRESQLKELILKGVESFFEKKIRELEEELFIVQDHEAALEEEAMHEEVLEEERRELDQFVWRTETAAPKKMRKRRKLTIDEELERLFTRMEKATEMQRAPFTRANVVEDNSKCCDDKKYNQ